MAPQGEGGVTVGAVVFLAASPHPKVPMQPLGYIPPFRSHSALQCEGSGVIFARNACDNLPGHIKMHSLVSIALPGPETGRHYLHDDRRYHAPHQSPRRHGAEHAVPIEHLIGTYVCCDSTVYGPFQIAWIIVLIGLSRIGK